VERKLLLGPRRGEGKPQKNRRQVRLPKENELRKKDRRSQRVDGRGTRGKSTQGETWGESHCLFDMKEEYKRKRGKKNSAATARGRASPGGKTGKRGKNPVSTLL